MTPPPAFRTLILASVALLPFLAPHSLEGQRTPWEVEAQVGGSFFFGNRDQTIFSTRGGIQRADSLFESATEFRFNYGTQTNDEGETSVSARSWSAGTELDFRPGERWVPFVSGNMESSFERRIALRYDTGAGLKMSFQDSENRRNRIDFGLQILAERTYARDEGGGSVPDEVSLTRWASNFRFRRQIFGDRLYVDSNNTYRPVFDSFGTFRMSSHNSFSYDLTEVVALRFSVRADYDSRQRDRGADTNYDGRSEISIVASF
ncbi:MAG: DUF481 domain-containing protein [Gemmatimonadota bacterium]